jgi:phosphate starvation-inducible PhoH-like protein
MRNKRKPRSTRTAYETEMSPRVRKEKFLIDIRQEGEETFESRNIPKFVPASDNQRKALAMLREGKKVVFLSGSSGSGKSMLAAYWAACKMKEKVVDNILLVRAAVGTGKTAGLLPGSEEEKLLPYFVQTLNHLGKFMGEGFLKYCREKEQITLNSMEYLRGRSLERCIVISEESQNMTEEDFEMLLSRMGENSTLILTGDFRQNDMKGKSGLHSTIDLIAKTLEDQPDYMLDEDLDQLENNVGVVVFTPEDCVRDGLTRAFVKMYHYK